MPHVTLQKVLVAPVGLSRLIGFGPFEDLFKDACDRGVETMVCRMASFFWSSSSALSRPFRSNFDLALQSNSCLPSIVAYHALFVFRHHGLDMILLPLQGRLP